MLSFSDMRACIHRGSKQIGGSCVEVISSGKRMLIDFGLPLDADINDEILEFTRTRKGEDFLNNLKTYNFTLEGGLTEW